MKKKISLFILVIAFALIMGGAYALYGSLSGEVDPSASMAVQEEAETSVAENMPLAPDFTVMDVADQSVALSDMAGKPVVVNFWASWCGPCQSEMPDFQQKYEEYGDRVTFMMVNMTEGRETVQTASDFVAAAGYTFPVYFDTQQSAAIAYGVNTIPATYFIDAEGRAIAYGLGALNEEIIQQGIDMILPAE